MLFSFAIFIVQIITMEGNQKKAQRETIFTTQKISVYQTTRNICSSFFFFTVVWSFTARKNKISEGN